MHHTIMKFFCFSSFLIASAINCDYDLITSIDADRETYLESYRNCTVNPKQFSGKTLAFVTPWNPIGFEHAKKFEEKLDYIVPAWFTIEGIENDEHIVSIALIFIIFSRLKELKICLFIMNGPTLFQVSRL